MAVSGKTLEILLFLSARYRREFSGYELSKQLGISSGTLYPLLLKLKAAGLLEDRWEGGDPKKLGRPVRRYYRISDTGAQAVEDKMRLLQPEYRRPRPPGGDPLPEPV
ncbi:MAG: PadR family transcriptional regulator [Pseudomonadota bacterium]